MGEGTVRVGDVSWLAGDRQLRLPMARRIACKGPYPLYAENCQPYGIDDYALEAGGTVMVSAVGQVLTSAGTLIAHLEPGRCSASEHVHAVVPHDPGDARYLWRVLTTTPAASFYVAGSSQLRQIAPSALMSLRIPWPDADRRAAFVAALDGYDDERARLNDLIPQLYACADEAYAAEVAASSEERVRVADVCRLARGTDVPAADRAPDKPVRVEGPNGRLGRCDEALVSEPAVMVGPSGRHLLAHYVDEPAHPIAEMAFVTRGACDVDLPMLLLALRNAGVLDRLHVNGELVGAAGLTMENLGDVALALGTPAAREAFAAKAADAVRDVCAAQRALDELARSRSELVASFFSETDYEPAGLPTPRGTTVFPAALGAAQAAPVTPAPGSDPALGVLGDIVREHSFGLAPDDVAWELGPLAVVRACADADEWGPVAAAARAVAQVDLSAAEGDPGSAPEAPAGVVAALDAAMALLSERDDLLSFLPNLSYASSLLTPAQLAQWVMLLDAIEPSAVTSDAVRAVFSLPPMARALPPAVATVFAGALRGAVAGMEARGDAGLLETAYVPYEADGTVIDMLARELPDVTLRAQFEDFPCMLASAMVRAVELRDARETRGGLGAAAGSALAADEFADWKAPIVCAALPPNAGEWHAEAPVADDPRWVLGTPPRNKANYAWLQHALAHQSHGGATLLLVGNAALHSTSGSEPLLRRTLVEQRRVRLVCALPAGVFGDDRPAMSLVALGDEGCADDILFVDALGEGRPIEGAGLRACPRRVVPDDLARAVADICEAWLGAAALPTPDAAPVPLRVASVNDVLAQGAMLAPWAYAPAR